MPLLKTVEIYPAVLSYPSYVLSQMLFKVKQADIPKAKVGTELLRTPVVGFGRPSLVDAYQRYFADCVSHHAANIVAIIREADVFVDNERIIEYVLEGPVDLRHFKLVTLKKMECAGVGPGLAADAPAEVLLNAVGAV